MIYIPSEVEYHFKKNLQQIDFCFIEFVQKYERMALVYLMSYLIREYDLVNSLNLNEQTLSEFLTKLVQGFNDQPYHNVGHSFNTVFFYGFLLQNGFQNLLTKLEILAMLLACAIHDYNHPGCDNGYLIRTHNELAMLYNDQSPLQNHFISTTLKLLHQNNFFNKIKEDQYLEFRKKITFMVVATDFNNWPLNIYLFDLRSKEQDFDPQGKDKEYLLKLAMAACDFNDAGLDFFSYKEYMFRIAKEYQIQGQLEQDGNFERSRKQDDKIGPGNYWWIENISVPTYDRLQKIIPAVSQWITRANENKFKIIQY